MPELSRFYIEALLGFHVQLLVAFPLLVALELAFPRGRQPSLIARLRSLVFWSVYALFSVAVLTVFGRVVGALGLAPLTSIEPFAHLPKPLGAVAAALVGFCIGDFFFYWLHRFEHACLWRFHRVHHSVRELNAIGGYHHVAEEAFRMVFITAPVFLLIGDPAAAAPVVGVIAYIQGHYLHSSTRLNFGPLRYVFFDNQGHRIHHSLEPRHFDKNFGAVTPLWDVLFGTAYFPRKDEWPDVGLEDTAEPQSILEYLLAPWRRRASTAVAQPA